MTRRKLVDSTSPLTFPPPSLSSSTSPPSSSDVSPSIMITVLILAIAVILSASLYLLLRFLRRNRQPSITYPHSLPAVSSPSLRQVSPIEKNPLIDTLPVFPFDSLSSKTSHMISGDCAVCLSKFERKDLLRLLPICCHAFHAECIDTWLSSNMTCPLCRSPIFLSDAELLGKLSGEHSRSFRVELGNVSHSRAANSGEIRRSYSLGGSFDYIVDDDAVSEVPAGSFRMTSSEFSKVISSGEQLGVLAGEVGRGGGWLKDYLSHSISSSRTASSRGSGRWFFTGSSRRSNTNMEVNELGEMEEASRLGDEIGELFRWLSGV